jgi:hypothetical protein
VARPNAYFRDYGAMRPASFALAGLMALSITRHAGAPACHPALGHSCVSC